ncbi:MAG: LysR family transcriptional regulator [Pseudomonadota bacterium]
MQTRALRTFVEIEKVGSFATAASRLNMTLSAVSMQMKSLEVELGAELFDRSHRPPRLTPLGRTIGARARQLLRAEGELRAACAPTDQLAGRYRIGFVPTASVRLLPAFLLNARIAAPDAEFSIVTGLSEALEDGVRGADLDFAVVTASAGNDPALAYATIREETLTFAAPPAPATLSPTELIEELSFLHFMPSSGIGKLISAKMEVFFGKGLRHTVLDSVEAILECVNAGVGFTLLPEPDVRRYAAPHTRIFSDGLEGLSRRLALVCAEQGQRREQAELVRGLFGK